MKTKTIDRLFVLQLTDEDGVTGLLWDDDDQLVTFSERESAEARRKDEINGEYFLPEDIAVDEIMLADPMTIPVNDDGT